MLKTMYDDGWFTDASVRFLVLEYTTFNVALNVYVIARFAVEASVTGNIIPASIVYPLCLHGDAYLSKFEASTMWIRWLLIIMCITMLLVYIRSMYRQMRDSANKLRILFNGWSWLDILNLSSVIAGIGAQMINEPWRAADALTLNTKINGNSTLMQSIIRPSSSIFVQSLMSAKDFTAGIVLMQGISMILLVIKYIKYFRVESELGVSCEMLMRNYDYLLSWLLIASIIILLFSMSATYLFGRVAFTMHNIVNSYMTMLRHLGNQWEKGSAQYPHIASVAEMLGIGRFGILYRMPLSDAINTPLSYSNTLIIERLWVIVLVSFGIWVLIFNLRAVIAISFITTRREMEERLLYIRASPQKGSGPSWV